MEVIASPMSPLFNTIEECKHDHQEKQKIIQMDRTKQSFTSMISRTKQPKQPSIFSLSNIMTAFANASFSNLRSKVADNIINDTSMTTDTSSTKLKPKKKNPHLTLHIVGIRDIVTSHTQIQVQDQNHDSSIESFVDQLKQKPNTEDETENKNNNNDNKSNFTFNNNEQKTGSYSNDSSDDDDDDDSSVMAPAGMFGDDDDESSDDSDIIVNTGNNNNNNSNIKKNKEKQKKKSGLCLKTVKTQLTADSTVKELKEYLALNNVFNLGEYLIFDLFHSNLCLDDDYRSLGYYGVSNNSFLLAAIKEGKPMNKREYNEEVEKCKLRISSEPAQFQSKNAKEVSTQSRPEPLTGNAALLAFTRLHVRNVNNGVTEAPRPQRRARHNNQEEEEEKKITKLVHLDMQNLVDNFKIERMSCVDFITYETDDNCVKMPCGHGMHPESLLGYVLSEINRKDTLHITCPHLVKNPKTGKDNLCRQEWHYPIIRKILLDTMMESQSQSQTQESEITRDQLLNFMKIELLIARNMLQEKYDAQKCGHCNTVLFRREKNLAAKMSDFQAVCPLCTVQHRNELLTQNNKDIKELELKIAELKKPRIFKAIKRVRKRLRFSRVKRDVNRLKNNLSDNINCINEKINMVSVSNIKSKLSFSNLLLDSIDEIEANGKEFNMNKKIQSKRYRRCKKEIEYECCGGYEEKIPKSFLNAFHTADDSDSDSSDDELEQKQKYEPIDAANVKGIFNPYFEQYIIANSSDSENGPTEYEYVTDESDDSDSDSSASPNLFGNSSDDDGNDNDDSSSSNYDVSSFECSDVEMKDHVVPIPRTERNEYYFGDSDGESEDLETETVAENRRNIFNTDSDSDGSDDSDDSDVDNDKESNVQNVAVKVKVKTELEIQIERMEYKLDRMRMRTFDNVKHNIMLCWGCGVAWKDVSSPACGNKDCSTSFRAQILSILRECPTKKIGQQKDVPSVRACVKCGQLINHWECCKHIECRECHTNFCFVCLKPYLKNGQGWQCGDYSSKCPDGVKKRQEIKDLPSMNVATVTLFDL